MIIAKSLTKKFGDFTAVNEVSLEVRKGECFGLLGPNGAGKSTFINMIYGMAPKTSGELTVFGIDPDKDARGIKRRLGVVTQDNALDESLSVIENMMIYAAFVGIPKTQRRSRVEELLGYMNLSHKRDARIQALSGGMKRRLVFVRALLGKPELLILDEPTTGLDPAVRHLLWGRVKELKDSGTTILLTTHYMHEAEVLCDRLAIFNEGKVISEGSPRQMIEQHTPGYVGIFSPETRPQIQNALNLHSEYQVTEDTSGIYLRTKTLDHLTQLHQDFKISPLQIRPANLEDVFLKLTGQELSHNA